MVMSLFGWIKVFDIVRFYLPVPGTYILANITSEHPIVKAVFKFPRDFTTVFNGQVGNTLSCIHGAICIDGMGRAFVQTQSAGPAVICYRLVIINFGINDKFTEKHI